MPHAPAPPCRIPGCPNLKPCPTEGHERKAWEGNTDRRRALGATLTTTQEERRRRRILTRHRGICHVCGEGGADEVDHVVPLAEGGADTDANLRPIHSDPCHRRKSDAERRRGQARARGR